MVRLRPVSLIPTEMVRTVPPAGDYVRATPRFAGSLLAVVARLHAFVLAALEVPVFALELALVLDPHLVLAAAAPRSFRACYVHEAACGGPEGECEGEDQRETAHYCHGCELSSRG